MENGLLQIATQGRLRETLSGESSSRARQSQKRRLTGKMNHHYLTRYYRYKVMKTKYSYCESVSMYTFGRFSILLTFIGAKLP